ncbi:hypothetical protein D6D19_00171 [Aureobasidium pullulans]|uniref:Uncharacterized protein n=1 Tax=Aureobasidium pullulans TaxID=5580 RepID=A0A4S9L977_AURPU|nr:hypothetical protein D6D19_00171 [Aureobasidium pullulans]THY25114.1 hypothetical protein D6D02_00367 [Aureobasidium pullulans]
MHQISFAILLLGILSLASLAHSCRPSMWVVGLKQNQTVGNHLIFIGRPILSIENRPEIPGYTVSVSENDTELIRAVRSDPNVGFVTKVSQNYFHKHEKFIEGARNGGYDDHFTKVAESMRRYHDDDDEDFIAEFIAEEVDDMIDHISTPYYHWRRLESADPEVYESGEGRREPLRWIVQLEKGYNIEEHINTITQFDPSSVMVNSDSSSFVSMDPFRYNRHGLKFRSEEQERISLPLMHADPRVENVWPGHCQQPGITYFTYVGGKEVPGWKDPCIWSLGYRRWETVSTPDVRETTTNLTHRTYRHRS